MENQSYIKYLKVCTEAVADEVVFEKFRSCVDYITVVEACGKQHGMGYIRIIKREFPHLVSYFPLFGKSDEIGSPEVFYYKEARQAFSPTTLRYVKVLGDLENLFGSLTDMDIIEIGGGYGGQCKIIHDIMTPRSYTIVDLPEALVLTEKYLRCFNIENIIYKTPNASFKNSYDLCISNYAFSEVDFNYQRRYAEKIMKHCNKGYMTCNHFSRNRTAQMYNLEIFRKGNFSAETPLTGVDNILYTWDHTVR